VEREQLPEFKRFWRLNSGAGRALLQNRQNFGSEKIATCWKKSGTPQTELPWPTPGAPAYSAISELRWSALRTTHSGPVCAAEP